MATDLGKVGMVMKGAWNSASTYEVMDVVTASSGMYIAKTAVPANTAVTNTTYWQPAFTFSSIPNITSFIVNYTSSKQVVIPLGSIIIGGRGSISAKCLYYYGMNNELIEFQNAANIVLSYADGKVTITNNYGSNIQITIISPFSSVVPS